MKWDRILPLSVGCLILISTAIVYEESQFLGFPDGHLTELAQAEKILANIFMGLSIVVSLWFGFLGWVASQQKISRKFGVTIICYTMFVLLLCAIYAYLRQRLDNGQGG